MDFYFGQEEAPSRFSSGGMQRRTIVHVSIDPDLAVLRFDVDLDSLPLEPYNGFEVVPNFRVLDFKNNGTFYTDSNGLEMQKRVLNYRPTWDLQLNYKLAFENVTANYYPINSAISVKESSADATSKRQFTVMNDRPQGGSALYDGTIEFMQNRRMAADDGKGVVEVLNETNADGQGIRVPATYYAQVFDASVRPSLQRLVQQKTDSPAQYFFSFEHPDPVSKEAPELDASPLNAGMASSLSSDLKAAGIEDTVKLILVPKGRNRLAVRLENIADLYDKEGKTHQVDIKMALSALWKEANAGGDAQLQDVIYEETSLSGNMPVKEMWARKIKWTTAAGGDQFKAANADFTSISSTSSSSLVALEPQRIRVFRVEFVPKSAKGNTLFMQD